MAATLQFFDAVALAAVTNELNGLGEARIDKVGQPSTYELYLQLRAGGKNLRLYINVRDQWARLHLTRRTPANVPVPSGFTMQLRKHLEGSRLLRVEQLGLERVVRLVVAGRDELGDPFERILVVELIGKYANMFLVDAQNEEVMGCLRPVTEAMCQVRQLGPGLPYDPPPVPAGKVSFLDASEADFLACLAEPGRLADRLVTRTAGLSKAAAGQLLAALGLAADVPTDAIEGLEALLAGLARAQASLRAGIFAPRLSAGPGWDYTMWGVGPGNAPDGPAASELLDAYYGGREDRAQLEERRRKLTVEVDGLAKKQRERLAGWEATAAKVEGAERQRELGDLLTSHMYLLSAGMASIEVDDFFAAEGAPTRVVVPLDPQLTPSQNVQRFFKRYQKARNGYKAVQDLLSVGRTEAAYLAEVATAIALAPETRDLTEIAAELAVLQGKPAGPAPRRGAPPEPPPAPLRLISSDGLPILVGKNSRQNEHVTFKEAHANDLWLHTQIIPGSHVVVRAEGPIPETTLHEAATLAAWFSQARESSRVPVVYTLKRHVRKPRGAKPGMVIYEQEKTLFVTPDPEVVAALLARPVQPAAAPRS